MMPGLFGNNLKINNILLDQNHVAKISSYNIPILGEAMKSEVDQSFLTVLSNLFFWLLLTRNVMMFVNPRREDLEASTILKGTYQDLIRTYAYDLVVSISTI